MKRAAGLLISIVAWATQSQPSGVFAQSLTDQANSQRGIVSGYVAVSGWPAGEQGSGPPASPQGFSVHLVPARNTAMEINKPAGTWFLPEEGWYRIWLEGRGLISPATLLNFGLRKAQAGERGLGRVFSVGPAGLVALQRGTTLKARQSLRLLGVPGGFARRASGDVAGRGVLMPKGQVVAAIFDEEKGEYLALSGPAAVHESAPIFVSPAPPAAPLSDLLVHAVLEGMPFDPKEVPALDAELADGAVRRPDVVAVDMNQLYAIWYALSSRTVTVRMKSRTLGAEPVGGALPSGQVRSLEMTCRELPSLGVALLLPQALPRDGLKLQALHRGELVSERSVEAGQDRVVFEALPIGVVELALISPPWTARQTVDMSDGKDRAIDFHVEAIAVRGRVRLCESNEPARLRFRTDGDQSAEVLTDRNGRFEAVLFQPVILYEVIPQGHQDALVEVLDEPIEADQELDLTIPCNDFRVEVRDGDTREEIPFARVSVQLKRAAASASSSRLMHCDDKGAVRLPPLPPGTLRLKVTADGYREWIGEERVADERAARSIDVLLWPENGARSVRVIQPDGRPASGARVALFSLGAESLLWEGDADNQGSLNVPDRPGATHLAAQHSGSFAVAQWRGDSSGGPYLVRIPPSRSVAVSVTDRDGRATCAGIALWVDGLRLTGQPLVWLTAAPAMTDSTGMWRPMGLPAVQIEALAWLRGRGLERQLLAGELDRRRVAIVPTGTSAVPLRALE